MKFGLLFVFWTMIKKEALRQELVFPREFLYEVTWRLPVMLRMKTEQLLLHQITQGNARRIDKAKIYGQ